MSSSLVSKRNRVVISLTLLIIFLVCFGAYVAHRALYRTSEFPAFRKFTRLGVFESRDMYREMEHARYYPPFFTIVFSVFSWSNVLVGAILFYATCCALFFLSAAACVRGTWQAEGDPPRKLYCWALLMGGGLFLDVVARCESDVLVLAPLCGAFYLLSRKRGFSAGLLISLAAAIKLTPICLAPYLLYKRELKALMGLAAGLLLFIILIPSVVWGVDGNYRIHRSWWDYTIVAHYRGGPRALVPNAYRDSNQSLTGAVFRYFTDTGARRLKGGKVRHVNVFSLEEGAAEAIVRVIQVCILVVLALACRAKTDDRLLLSMEYSLVLVAILELCGISWTSHHIILLIPYTAAASYWYQHTGAEGDGGSVNVRIVRAGLVLSLTLMCLAAVPYLRSLSALFFATITMFVTFSVVLLRTAREGGQAEK